MAATDRYVFAKVTPCACGQTWCKDVDTALTGIPAPDPADWQAIVDAVDAPSLHTLRKAVDAAVRNMREAER